MSGIMHKIFVQSVAFSIGITIPGLTIAQTAGEFVVSATRPVGILYISPNVELIEGLMGRSIGTFQVIDGKRLASAPIGWLPVYGEGKTVWVRRQDVHLASEFKKVTGCWPVRTSISTSGEAVTWDIKFKPDGSALVIDDIKHPKERYKAHVYMAGNYVYVRLDKRLSPVYVGHRLLPDGHKGLSYYLTQTPKMSFDSMSDYQADIQEFYSAKDLKGCSGIVTK